MNSEKILGNLININFFISNNILYPTKFLENTLENKYQIESFNSSKKFDLAFNSIIIFGYLASYIFITFAFYRVIFIITCSFFFLLSLISLIFSTIRNTKLIKFYNSHIQIFLQSIFLITKALIICVCYNSPENDHHQEIVRIIIYHFVAISIYIVTSLESNIYVYFFYFLQNIFIIIISMIYSNQDNFYYLEGITSFFVSLICYLLRKEWDYKLRLIFAEKYKFQFFFMYTSDYINGLNGYNLNVKNHKNILYNNKFINLVERIQRDIPDFQYETENKNENVFTQGEEDFTFNKLDENYPNDGNKHKIMFMLKNLIFYGETDNEDSLIRSNQDLSIFFFFKMKIFLKKIN